MPTIAPRTDRRYSSAEQLFIDHQDALLSYITNRLPATDWRAAEDLARETWTGALDSRRVDITDAPSALPDWLTRQARIVLRRYLSPVPDGNEVRVDKGPTVLPRAVAVKRLPRIVAAGPIPTPAAVFGRRPAAVAAAA
ncbi:hypothetical protein [Streptomyces sp. ME19-01-6]|uniref:hypothetical protein n=1 Tax=Streptomyces sp. ME19-01-6 TaxID=3028686 RepID=UPI0029B385A6|nr:hypothetical protein [Streptomyces sp. ME19-01-6]MDX3232532.1 hypothetical protein [Streptomyces sp. ME19-01-6]